MKVIKRDGRREPVSFDKVLRRLELLGSGLHQDGIRFGRELDIDVTPISQKVISQIRDGITTRELDEFSASTCANMVKEHPDYSDLAGRVVVSNHHKNTGGSFVDTIKYLYSNRDVHGKPSPLINTQTYKVITNNRNILEGMIDYNRDFMIDYFGFKTLERSYLLKSKAGHFEVQERPQHMYMRVAVGIHGDHLDEVKTTYDLLSLQKLSHASPTLFNAGTPHTQCSSCFLAGMDDSLSSIYDCLKKCAMISKHAGGIGIWAHRVRAKGSKIRGTHGESDGLIPMLRVFNETARYVNQGGKRKGSIAVYLEPHHADIEDFLDLKKTHGDMNRRALDLFLALWISDLFMKRLDQALPDDKSVMWSLFCPDEAPGLEEVYGDEYEKLYTKYEKEGRARKQVPILNIWEKVLAAQKETGVPYILYKDCVNYRNAQANIGVIKSSNLCVAPNTMILTDRGYYEIKDLKNQRVNVWNGESFSETIVRKTGINQEMVRVKVSNGSILECTKYHKFYVHIKVPRYNKSKNIHQNSLYVRVVEAKDLEPGMKLIKCDYPVIKSEERFRYPYTHGAFCGDGTYEGMRDEITQCNKRSRQGIAYCGRHLEQQIDGVISSKCIALIGCGIPRLSLYNEKKKLSQFLDLRKGFEPKEDKSGRLNCKLPLDLPEKFEVPINVCIQDKLEWFAGYADTDGTIAQNGLNESLQITSINVKFLNHIKLMLQTLGCDPKVTLNRYERNQLLPDHKGNMKLYKCNPTYRLLVNSNDLCHLISLGFSPKRLVVSGKKPQRNARHFITIESVTDLEEKSDTYCFKEEKRGLGIFNGIITGQCAEVVLVNDPGDETISVCNLAAIPLGSYIKETIITDQEGNPQIMREFDFEDLGVSVGVAIENLNKIIDLNFYPVKDCANSNFRDRPVGLGVVGLYDAFIKLRYAFDSDEAQQLNREIFECMYYHAVKTTMELSKKDGPYSTFEGSPASQGKLQIDMWNEDRARYGHAPTELCGRYDWDQMKKDVMKYGMRNSTLMACMPTASTAQIIGQTESFECMTYNMYRRQVLSGDFKLVNKYLQRDLIKLGLWDDEFAERMIASRGSIQKFDDVPDELKSLYRGAFEIKQRVMLDLAIGRSPFLDQTQSLNIFVSDPTNQILSSIQMYAFKNRLKTGQYYLRREAKAKAVQFTVRPVKGRKKITSRMHERRKKEKKDKKMKQDIKEDQEDISLCLLSNPACEACQV